MALEAAGFATHHQERREVYLRRIAVFPAGALVAEQDTRIAGCFFSEIWGTCAATPNADHFRLGHDIRDRHDAENGTTLYVSSMTLAPALRGQRLGEPFFAGCIDHVTARFPRLDNVLLLVNENWERARSIYASVRFRELARLPRSAGRRWNCDASRNPGTLKPTPENEQGPQGLPAGLSSFHDNKTPDQTDSALTCWITSPMACWAEPYSRRVFSL